MTCNKGKMVEIGSPWWPGATMVPFLQNSRLLCLGGGIYNILGFIHLSVITIRARGKIRELNSRIRS